MKRIQNVALLVLVTLGLSFFYACDREECHDSIPEIEETIGTDFPSLVYADDATIAEMFEGSQAELIGYLASEERAIYVDFQFYETVQAELSAEGFEEVWFIQEPGSSEGTPYQVQPIENLDLSAVPKSSSKFTIKRATCVTLKKSDDDCYNIEQPGVGIWPSFKLKQDVRICKVTGNNSDVCTFDKYNAAKVTAYSKKDCKGESKEATYNFPDC